MSARAGSHSHRLTHGVTAHPHGLLFLESSRALVAADAHLAYEEAIGGALPLWSTAESTAILLDAAARTQAREIVLLGDIIHGSRMSEGAAGVVRAALAQLRAFCAVTLVAGNHEGRTRGAVVLGETEDAIERDGWILLHGDEPLRGPRCIVGHLHPSLPLGGGAHVPVFLGSERFVVVPALTPYSSGLNVLSRPASSALKRFVEKTSALSVVASVEDRVYAFGTLGELRGALQRPGAAAKRGFARRLRPDGGQHPEPL